MSAVLLAVTGLSPAIVTETVWALAREKPRTLPGRVIFLTTAVGAVKIQEQLFTPLPALGGVSAWQALRIALHAGPEELIAEPTRLIGKSDPATGSLTPLPDIITPQDNEIAASFLLEQVRGIAENPDTPLIASIAGGRKTMGALLHAAVSLLGRETDRLTHVLVSPPYESLPGFFFPGQPGGLLRDRDGIAHDPAAAIVALADVPFVPLRNRFADLSEMPGSFTGLVDKYSRTIREDAARPAGLIIDHWQRTLTIDGTVLKLPQKMLAIVHFLLEAQSADTSPFDFTEAGERINPWLAAQGNEVIPLARKPRLIEAREITHDLSDLRTRLRKAGLAWTIPPGSLTPRPSTCRVLTRSAAGLATG